MIWAVTANPALDYTYRVPALEHGEVHRVKDVTVRPGGKGVNVARVADALGQEVTATGPVGGAAGEVLVDLLSQIAPGVNQAWVRTAATTRNSVAVVDDQATVFNEAGMPLEPGDWQELQHLLQEQVKPGDVVCFSGSFPPQTPEGTLTALVAAARKPGVVVIVDTSGPMLLEAAQVADLIKPNTHELLAATGAGTISAGIEALQSRGAGLIALSKGEDGMEIHTPTGWLSAKVPDPITGNPTGAGDASVAAWAKFFASSGESTVPNLDDLSLADLSDPLVDAVATSAASVARPTAGDIDPELRLALLDQITVQEHIR